MKVNVFLYPHYEYENSPLAFAVLPAPLSAEQKVRLMELVDELYADTPQQTTDWALEYQLWVRMLICDSVESLPVNTFAHHLEMGPENVALICDVLGANSDNANVFRICAENKQLHNLICALYKEDPDLAEGFSVQYQNETFCPDIEKEAVYHD